MTPQQTPDLAPATPAPQEEKSRLQSLIDEANKAPLIGGEPTTTPLAPAINREDILKQASEDGIVALRGNEINQVGSEAVKAMLSGTGEIPTIKARRAAAEAPAPTPTATQTR